MKYPAELYRKADDILSTRRQHTAYELDRRRDRLSEQYPDIQKTHQEVSVLGAQMGIAFINRPEEREQYEADYQAAVDRLGHELAVAGLPEDYLREQPMCRVCPETMSRGVITAASIGKWSSPVQFIRAPSGADF